MRCARASEGQEVHGRSEGIWDGMTRVPEDVLYPDCWGAMAGTCEKEPQVCHCPKDGSDAVVEACEGKPGAHHQPEDLGGTAANAQDDEPSSINNMRPILYRGVCGTVGKDAKGESGVHG